MMSARQIYLGSQSKPALPYDAEVEYLESTGTQWIDTGVKISDGFGYSISFAVTVRGGLDSSTMFFCGYGVPWDAGISLCEDTETGVQTGIRGVYGGDRKPASGIRSVVGTRYNVEVTANPYTMTITGGAAFSASFVPGSTFTGTNNFTLFRGPYAATVTALNPKGMKLYAFSLTDGDKELVRDMIPVRFTNEQGVSEGAMYDRVSGQLFRNSGTGVFGFGTDIAGGGRGYKCLGYSPLRFSHFSRLWKEAA